MILINMTNRVQIQECLIRRLNKGNFYLLSHSFEILWFISGMEVGTKCIITAHISKITPARPKNTGTWGMN